MINVQTGSGMKNLSPEEVSAMVLSKMKGIAEDYLGQNVTHAVVTVPACKYRQDSFKICKGERFCDDF